MAETTAQPPDGLTGQTEEAAFYHETTLNAAWTGARLALGGLSFGFGAFVFAYFYLRSLNSHGLWHPAGFKNPQPWAGAVVMGLIVVSALVQTLVLQRIKAGHKAPWQAGAAVALVLGLGAIGLQVWQLLNLPFFPGSAGFASVFVGATPVFVLVVFCAMIWLEILIAKARQDPGDLVRRAAADLRRGVPRTAVPGFAQLVHPRLELSRRDRGPVLGAVLPRRLKEAEVPAVLAAATGSDWNAGGSILTFYFPCRALHRHRCDPVPAVRAGRTKGFRLTAP